MQECKNSKFKVQKSKVKIQNEERRGRIENLGQFFATKIYQGVRSSLLMK